MKFIKPNSVSGEILNLLDEAKEKVVFVSPYCKFDKWYRLVNKINDLKDRNISFEFYIRKGEKESNEQIESLGITPISISNLHCKLYFNEKKAIITSMNLLLSSEINSLEIGYMTETIEEYKEIIDFYTTYLNKALIEQDNDDDDDDGDDFDWIKTIYNSLIEKVGRNKITFNDNKIHINTSSNNYDLFIWRNRKVNKLRMSGILSGGEFEYAKTIKENIKIKNIEIELYEGVDRFDSIWATCDIELKATCFEELLPIETKLIINPIINFITKIEEIKNFHYKNSKL